MRRFLLIAALLVWQGRLVAGEPSITAVDVRGLQLGAKTTVTVTGAELSTAPQLLLPFKATKVELKSGNTATKAVFEIELGKEVPIGIYQWRLATSDGVTAPVVIGIDPLPQLPFAPQIETLPVALHGQVAGSAALETKFTGKAGDELTIEVEAARLGSKLRPVLHLFDESRRQLAWSWPQRNLFGDARLVVKLPADGAYTVQIHDVEYQAPNPSFFRLKVGTWQSADVAFPSAVERNKKTAIELVSRTAGTKVEVDPVAGQYFAANWPANATASGRRIPLLISDIPELLEQPPRETPQEITSLPVAIHGRLAAANEQDKFRIVAPAGTKLKLELFAERVGSTIDGVLVLQNDKGVQVARGDDGPGTTDPVIEYTMPDKVDRVDVVVSDLLQRGGPTAIYRLVITTPADASLQRDFRLFTTADRFRVAQNGLAVLPIIVERKGYDGPIIIAATGLPPGVTVSNAEIPAGAEGTLLTLVGAASGNVPAISSVTLRGASDDGKLIRELVFDQHPLGDFQPWLRSELAVSLAAENKFKLDWGNLPADASLLLGNKANLPIKVTRPEGEATAVRLTLVAAQNAPKQGANPDPNRTLRAEKAIEIEPAKTDGEQPVFVPTDLPAAAYDVAIVGELLSKDKKTVLAVSSTPPRRLPTANPLSLQFANTKLAATLNAKTGATIKLPGKLERLGEFKGNVTIAATGLPAGAKIDNVVVKPEASDFEVTIVFPANTPPGEVTSIRLTASGPPDPARANVLVKTKELPLTIQLAAEAK